MVASMSAWDEQDPAAQRREDLRQPVREGLKHLTQATVVAVPGPVRRALQSPRVTVVAA